MIRIHYFTYSREAGYIVESVASLCRSMTSAGHVSAENYDITVIDDAYDHMSPVVCDELRSLGVDYRRSTFSRGGNLRGQACLMGILSEYERTCQGRADDVVVKLDPDTIVRRVGWLSEMLPRDNGVDMVYCDDRGAMYGMAYAFHASLLPDLIDYFATMPIPDKGQEDIYLGHRLRRLAHNPRQIPIWAGRRYGDDVNGPDGIVTCYNWPGCQGGFPPVYDQFDIINVGQARQYWVTNDLMIDLIRQMVPPLPAASTVLPGASCSPADWSPFPPSIFNNL